MATTATPSDIANIAGPILLAIFFHWGLFGILTVQVYLYYLVFPRDSTAFKTLVYATYLIEIAQTLLLTHDAFIMYAQKFGVVGAPSAVQTSWFAVPVLCGTVSYAVQLSYTYRIYILSKSKLLTFGISIIALTQAIAGIIGGIQAHRVANYSQVESTAFVAVIFWFSGSALCDLVIAASMTVLLRRCDSGIRATHALVAKLIWFIVETGSLTAAFALAEVALFFAFPNLNYYACLSIIRAKLYSNALLIVFNSRIRINSQMETDSVIISCSNFGNDATPGFTTQSASRTLNSTIILGGIHGIDETWVVLRA